MKKPWSLSTTVRNPERILPFLRTLKEMEGEDFDQNGQIKFQTLLIKNRLYRPNHLPEGLSKYYESIEDTMSFDHAKEIFQFMLSNSSELQRSPGIRGRTSVSPLTQKGFAIAKQSRGAVKITDLGNIFLEKGDLGEVLLSYFLKWQLPNPLDDYTFEQGYNLKPFLATLTLIKRVNELCTNAGIIPKGLSKNEFSIFVPTLISLDDIDKNAQKILQLRGLLAHKNRNEQREIRKQFKHDFISEWLETEDEGEIERNINNLKDYGDSILRNFRLTRYLYIRGNGYYVDLEPRRNVEITQILDNIELCARTFENESDYFEYISNPLLPELPWENIENLTKIIESITFEIREYEGLLNVPPLQIPEFHSVEEAKLIANNLRDYRRELQEKHKHQKSQDTNAVDEYIGKLSNIYQLDDRSLQLEKYSSLSLHSLNDALNIKPNYSVGDDSEPIFTAPAGTPDIECYYNSFNAICEVTMLKSRDQWYNEGQPVMRHLRDFEEKSPNIKSYCLFIAPELHRDTLNTFWNAVKYEYEGEKQRIVPMSINSFVKVLNVLLVFKHSGKPFLHTMLQRLYDKVIDRVMTSTNSENWYALIPSLIDQWKQEILNEN